MSNIWYKLEDAYIRADKNIEGGKREIAFRDKTFLMQQDIIPSKDVYEQGHRGPLYMDNTHIEQFLALLDVERKATVPDGWQSGASIASDEAFSGHVQKTLINRVRREVEAKYDQVKGKQTLAEGGAPTTVEYCGENITMGRYTVNGKTPFYYAPEAKEAMQRIVTTMSQEHKAEKSAAYMATFIKNSQKSSGRG